MNVKRPFPGLLHFKQSFEPDFARVFFSVNLLLLSSRFETICPQPETGKKAFVVGEH